VTTTFQRILLAAIIALTIGFSLRSNAEGTRARVNIFGLGSERCDILQSAESRKREIILWIEGFSSGLNYVAAASDQKQSTRYGYDDGRGGKGLPPKTISDFGDGRLDRVSDVKRKVKRGVLS